MGKENGQHHMDEDSAKSSKTTTEAAAKRLPGSRNGKAQGELAELAFMHKAASLGFGVAKPYGDNRRYDFILEAGGRLSRVQVKSTQSAFGRGYRVHSHGNTRFGKTTYTPEEIDFLVAHIHGENIWYVVPAYAIVNRDGLCLYPHGSRKNAGRFEQYREAWHLMK